MSFNNFNSVIFRIKIEFLAISNIKERKKYHIIMHFTEVVEHYSRETIWPAAWGACWRQVNVKQLSVRHQMSLRNYPRNVRSYSKGTPLVLPMVLESFNATQLLFYIAQDFKSKALELRNHPTEFLSRPVALVYSTIDT